jgi:hypothetical protein
VKKIGASKLKKQLAWIGVAVPPVDVAVAIAVVLAKSTKSSARRTAVGVGGGRHTMVLEELVLELSPFRSDPLRGLLNIQRVG